jgi:hypothetical protein
MESTRWDETWHRLREWTNSQAQSERLAAQILINEGFEGLDPSHPLGGPDGGRDATCTYDDELWIMAVYFPRGKKKISEIEKKLREDVASAVMHKPAGIAFVTNQELSLAQRDRLKRIVSPSRLVIFHLERIATILDTPHMSGIRQQFLGIECIDSKPVLDVGFYEPGTRTALGKSIQLCCVAHDSPTAYIPSLETPRQMFSGGISLPLAFGEELNPTYMRDKEKYERTKALLREVTIGIRNTSTRLAEGVILEVEGSLSNGIEVLEEFPQSPARRRLEAIPYIRPSWWNSRITPSVEKFRENFRVTVQFRTIQPGHISIMDVPILIGSKDALSLNVNAKVVANNLPVPTETSLEIRFEVTRKPSFSIDYLRL